MVRHVGFLLGAIVACVLVPGRMPATGEDEAFAKFLFDRGEKEFKAKDYAAAVETFTRALQERAHFPEASYALGEALEKVDRLLDALGAYRQCAAEVDLLTQPTSKQKSLASKAKRALSRLQRLFADLDKLDKAFVTRSLALASEKALTNPDLARRIYETVLAVEPDNAVALAGLGSSSKPSAAGPPSTSKGEGRLLIDSDELENWSPGVGDVWSCTGGVITAEVKTRDGKINWLEEPRLEGRYRLSAQFRVTRAGSDRRACGLFLGGDGRDFWFSLILTSSDKLVLDRYVKGDVSPLKDYEPAKFDRGAWHDLRLDVSPGALRVELDGKLAFEQLEDRRDAFEGKLALFCQDCSVEFREIRVTP